MIETYREALRALRFQPLDDAALAAARIASAAGHHNNAIEGLPGTAELRALFEMLLEERAPVAASRAIVGRYVRERLLGAGAGAPPAPETPDPVDPYALAGSTVLRNRLGVRDAESLGLAEYALTRDRQRDVTAVPLTVAGYQAVHRHVFGDLYAWAGELRTVRIAKGRTMFCYPEFIAKEMAKLFTVLAAASGFRGLVLPEFAARAAHHIAELNAIHPFREGNGRTMRLHLAQLARQAGHGFDMLAIERILWMTASIAANEGDEALLREVIEVACRCSQGRGVGRTA